MNASRWRTRLRVRPICLRVRPICPTERELHPRPGYCYVDASDYQYDRTDSLGGAANASPDFRARLKNCPVAEQRTLRFVGSDTPWPNSVTYALCRNVELLDEAPM